MRSKLMWIFVGMSLVVGLNFLTSRFTAQANEDHSAMVTPEPEVKFAGTNFNNEVIERAELDRDTPEDVQKAGRDGLEKIKAYRTMVEEANHLFERMAKDKDYARQLLELSQKGDQAEIVALLKQEAKQSEVEILKIKDFTIWFKYKRHGTMVAFCETSERGGCQSAMA